MKKIYKIILILGVMLLFITTNVKATNSFKLNVTANKTSLKPGDTVEITLNVSDINVGEVGINTVEGTIEYDNEIFEDITASNIQSLNNWSLTYNSEETEYKGKILAVILQSGVTEKQDIGKITLKVKSDVKDTTTLIKIKNIASNDGNELINETDKEIKFEIKEEKVTIPEDNTDKSEENKDNTITKPDENVNQKDENTSKPENNINETKKNESNTEADTSKGPLPQTGIINYIIITIGTMVIVFGIITLIKYNKIDK